MAVEKLPPPGLVRVELRVDVRDAMGANVLNSAAERLRGMLETVSGGAALMCILSNSARERRAGARFSLPLDHLWHAGRPGMPPEALARRIVAASAVAQADPERAVTHNKGIMNGISALALATGNDTRAIEAAAHAWAARTGEYRGLSSFSLVEAAGGPALAGELELPLALGSVGGSVGFHPASAFSLRLLGHPSGVGLARIAAALGLAQNFAALLALVGEGIQRGHMRLHASRIAYRAGAREREIPLVASRLASRAAAGGHIEPAEVSAILDEVRRERGGAAGAGYSPEPGG
jgi:hydroxymethylglutaryl-CoA reductase